MPEPAANTPSRDGIFAVLFDLLFSLFFLSVIGVLFVAFCVLLGKYELLILAYVLLSAAVVRPFVSDERMKKLQRVAIIGEGLKIFTHLERYYLEHPPRSIFFYIFFPITGIFSFFFSKDRGRRELKAHFILIQWILVLLLIQGFASYSRFYQHFPWKFATSWLYMELLAVYFLCNFFAIPAATTPMRLSVSGRRTRLFVVSAMALLVMTSFLYMYKRGAVYDNLVPINIAMDRRMDALKQRVQLDFYRQQRGLPPLRKRKIAGRPDPEEFFTHFQNISEMYLRYHAPRLFAIFSEHRFDKTPKPRDEAIERFNQDFQAHLQRISVFGEHEQIFLTMNQRLDDIWGIIVMPFRENLFYTFRITHTKKVQFYRRWEDMPQQERAMFLAWWNKRLYRFASEKRLARVIVDTMRDLSRRMAPEEPLPLEEPPSPPMKDERSKTGSSPSAKGTSGTKNEAESKRRLFKGDLPQKEKEFSPKAKEAPSDASPSPQKLVRKKQTAKPKSFRAYKRRRQRPEISPQTAPPPTPSSAYKAPAPAQPRISPSLEAHGPTRKRDFRPRKRKRARRARRSPRKEIRLEPSSSIVPPLRSRRMRRVLRWRMVRQLTQIAHPSMQMEVQKLNQIRRTLNDLLFVIHYTQKNLVYALTEHHFVPRKKLTRTMTLKQKLDAYWYDGWFKALSLQLPTSPLPKRPQHLPSSFQAWGSLRSILTASAKNKEMLAYFEAIPGLSLPSDEQLTPERTLKLREQLHRTIEQHRWLHIWLQQQKDFLLVAERQWKQAQQTAKRTESYFLLYNTALRELHLERAISAKLLFDHFGNTPALPPLWWADLYEYFLRLLLFLFQLTMPFHILLIFYCQFRIRDPEDEAKQAN